VKDIGPSERKLPGRDERFLTEILVESNQ
jgi:hypothetical protein